MALADPAADIAESALAAVVAEFTTRGVAVPALQYVTVGELVPDGELLVVSVQRMHGVQATGGFPSEAVEPLRCLQWRAVQLSVAIQRCAPEPKVVRGQVEAPSNTDQTTAARRALDDAEIIRLGLVRAYRAGDFGEGDVFAFEDWLPYPVAGGLIGGRLNVRIGLTG